MENEVMQQVLIFTTLLAPIVAAVIEVVKKTINVPKNILPALSLIIGLLIGVAAYPFTDMGVFLRLWAGAFAGLGGTGLYELVSKREGTTK